MKKDPASRKLTWSHTVKTPQKSKIWTRWPVPNFYQPYGYLCSCCIAHNRQLPKRSIECDTDSVFHCSELIQTMAVNSLMTWRLYRYCLNEEITFTRFRHTRKTIRRESNRRTDPLCAIPSVINAGKRNKNWCSQKVFMTIAELWCQIDLKTAKLWKISR